MTHGINISAGGALGWRIIGCEFSGLLNNGINHAAAGGQRAFSQISGNQFRSCASGIVTANGIIQCVISDNTFDTITGWCIDFSGIATTTDLMDCTITGNIAGSTVTNGLRIALSTGTWDRCILKGNNMHSASGTKWTLAAGNAAGFVTENITT
jgi:hypothetical protein